ncbi:MAG: cell division protein ZapA [Bacteroidaceae bacterium]|nr:cell division protein ZapA [Bacteroidaceae bacterium]
MEDRIVGINLIIDGVSYPLSVPASEEPYYRQAARLINDTLIPYNKAFSEQGSQKVLTMVAIDIAYRLVSKTDNTGMAQTMRKIAELSRLIDDTLQE